MGVLRGHEQEICGLKWSPNGQQLASGANDNLLHIWDRGGSMLHRVTAHQAAVKGLAWCPFQSNLLASGGGTADRCIRFTNTHTGCVLNSIDTGSQVGHQSAGAAVAGTAAYLSEVGKDCCTGCGWRSAVSRLDLSCAAGQLACHQLCCLFTRAPTLSLLRRCASCSGVVTSVRS